ncbi:MAG: radical SAM protein [Rhodopila sp.]
MNPFKARPLPSWVVFQLLERCNLRCSMCYEWGETGAYHERDATAELPLPLVLRTVRECLPARPFFEFFGGEPLLYAGIWDVIDLIRSGGCELAFPTNGTLLEQHAERLVRQGPTQLWISMDGPRAINDLQRGRGVFARVMRGFDALARAGRAAGANMPAVGLTYVVTPLNHRHIAEFFLETIGLTRLAAVSIELQSYISEAQNQAYAAVARSEFGVGDTPCARAYVRHPSAFASMDVEAVSQQMTQVREICAARGIRFYSQPRSLAVPDLQHYLGATWEQMSERHHRCGVPWAQAEISARGDVSTCHSFYDIAIGNLHEQGLAEIWQGEKARQLRAYLRKTLFPVCTACCRYYTNTPAPGHMQANARPNG